MGCGGLPEPFNEDVRRFMGVRRKQLQQRRHPSFESRKGVFTKYVAADASGSALGLARGH